MSIGKNIVFGEIVQPKNLKNRIFFQPRHLHVYQSIVGDGKPLRQIQSQGLFPVGENVPRNLEEHRLQYIKMDCLNDRITIPQKTTKRQLGCFYSPQNAPSACW